MAKDKVELSSLVNVPYNPRIIKREELERLKASIKKHTKAIPEEERGDGYRLTTTVTINKQGNRIVGGCQRIKALKALKQDWIHNKDITWVDLVPDSAEEKALNVTLNNERAAGSWDFHKLAVIVDEIRVENVELYGELSLADINIVVPEIEEISVSTDNKKEDNEEEYEDENEEPVGETDKPSETNNSEGNNVSVESSDNQETNSNDVVVESNETKQDVPNIEEQLLPLSYAVTAAQRKIILAAITLAKNRFNKQTSAESLTEICSLFIANNPEDKKE